MEFKSFSVRGFPGLEFTDTYGYSCSIQKSSSISNDTIWFGLNDASPKVLHGDARALGIDTDATCGWVEYPIPPEVSLNTRMYLSREQVRDLLPILQAFADTGEIDLHKQPAAGRERALEAGAEFVPLDLVRMATAQRLDAVIAAVRNGFGALSKHFVVTGTAKDILVDDKESFSALLTVTTLPISTDEGETAARTSHIQVDIIGGEPVLIWGEDSEQPIDAAHLFADLYMSTLSITTPQPAPVQAVDSDQQKRADDVEARVQAMIDNAPEPVHKLGEWLTKVLDDDHWPTAERLLLGACQAPGQAIHSCKLGLYGKAFDAPDEKRAYTYEHQPDNVVAHRLGSAARSIVGAGDYIDTGLGLLKELSNLGFGIFELNDSPAEAPVQAVPEGWKLAPAETGEAVAIANLVRMKLRSWNSVPVDRCVITKAEIDALCTAPSPTSSGQREG